MNMELVAHFTNTKLDGQIHPLSTNSSYDAMRKWYTNHMPTLAKKKSRPAATGKKDFLIVSSILNWQGP